MVELLAQQCLVILMLFPVSTIEIHKAQYKYNCQACQQFSTHLGDQTMWHISRHTVAQEAGA